MATHAWLVAILVGASLGATADAPPPKDQEILLSASQALVGADPLCVALAVTGAEQSLRLVDTPKLKTQIVGKISGAGIKHVEDERGLVPKLVARIEGTPVPDSDKVVCRVQVSLIRQVLLSRLLNLSVPAEVWQGRPVTVVAAKAGVAETVSSAVASQVEAFLDSYKTAATFSTLPAGVKADHAASAASGYSFIASKDSQVFHRPDCRWAQNIASDNRVGYKSRQEAAQAGKRPCKTCKP